MIIINIDNFLIFLINYAYSIRVSCDIIDLDNNYIILGPTAANVFMMNKIYHFEISIKYKNKDINIEKNVVLGRNRWKIENQEFYNQKKECLILRI